MITLHRTTERNLRTFVALVASKTNSRTFSKDYDSSDDEKQPKKEAKPKTIGPAKCESAADRLNRLLASMQADDPLSVAGMARPGEAHKQRKEAAKQEATAKDVISAAKNVANMLGSNEEVKKQTESELLAKLLGHNQEAESTKDGVAETTKTPKAELNLSDLIVGMKIDRRQQPQEQSRGEYVRRTLASKSTPPHDKQNAQQRYSKKFVKREAETYTGSVNLFGGEPLGIFKQPETLLDSPDILTTWAQINKHELKLQAMHPPANYYEKMVRWTEQGKLWKFPIDNEQDMNEEINVDFSEHIFLEQHLESWCPNKGPLRHFMELVCVGLSKNPYITAKEKKEHILWFQNYFEAKKDLLKDLMSKEQMEKATKQVTA